MIYGDDPYEEGVLPYIDYVYSDKSGYPSAVSAGYKDDDNDYLVGNSGGFLMKIDFMFIGTKAFCEVADYYTQNGTYTRSKYGSPEYHTFWARETVRRKVGMTINGKLYFKDVAEYFHSNTTEKRKKELLHPLHITGDHYSYLNYGRIFRTKTPEEIAADPANKVKKQFGFPRFWDGDYWNFKFDNFLANNGFHGCKGKARRKGYSYKRGHQAANTINLFPNVTIILAAYLIDYLTDPGATTDMVKTNLDWLEDNTYWKRGYLSQDLEAIELGYRKKRSGNKKFGWKSKCISVSLFSNASAAIGKDGYEIDFEEAGKCKNLQKALDLTLSSTEAGGIQSGTIRVYGTGGTEEADWEPFAKVFYNPRANKMMPLENIYDPNARGEVCGFFHPQILNYEPLLDEHGNSYLMKAYKFDLADKELARENKSLSEYIIYVGQRANTPAEAFKLGSENIFSSTELTDHYNHLLVNTSKIHYRDGMLFEGDNGVRFKTNAQLDGEGKKDLIHPFVDSVPFDPKDDIAGCIREFYPPFKIDGKVPDNLYYLVIDPIGKDRSTKNLTIKHSLYSVQVWMYPNTISNSTGDILVAHYIGRRNTEYEMNAISMKLARYYNAKALPETDRGNVVADFKKDGMVTYLMRDPSVAIDNPNKAILNANFGINIGNGINADNYTIGFRDFLYTVVSRDENGTPTYLFQYILDTGYVKELLKYNNSGNFDRISAGRIAPVARRAFVLSKKQASSSPTNSQQTTIGSIYSN